MKIKKSSILLASMFVLFLTIGFFLLIRYMNFKSYTEEPIAAQIAEREEEILEEAEKIKYVGIAGQKIKVDLALTHAERNQGLSGRPKLEENEGMLFVFDKPGKHSFWMKDMNFPIDIIWIDDNFNMVVHIKENARPESYPEAYAPSEDDNELARYVLEVPAGFSRKNNLKIGDRVGFINQDGSVITN